MALRLVYALLALLMAISAVVQLNDPDPAVWVAAYGAATLVLAAAAAGRSDRRVTVAVILLLAVLAAAAAPGFVSWLTEHRGESITGAMSDDKPYIEQTREFLGLAIAVGCLALLALRPPSSKLTSRASEPGD